jgi:hypothetical protein
MGSKPAHGQGLRERGQIVMVSRDQTGSDKAEKSREK